MGISRPWDFDLRFLSIFHVEMVAKCHFSEVFFIQFAWQAYVCPGKLHQSWNDEQIYDFSLTLSVLSLMCSIVYEAGKGLIGYIHAHTMLTSPAILGPLFLTIPKSYYLF